MAYLASLSKESECAICLEKLTDDWCSILSCRHVFHRKCLFTYYTDLATEKNPCPACRRPAMNYFEVAITALDHYFDKGREGRHFQAAKYILQRYHVYLSHGEKRLENVKRILNYKSSALYCLLAFYRHMPLYVKTETIQSTEDMIQFLDNYVEGNPKTVALYKAHLVSATNKQK